MLSSVRISKTIHVVRVCPSLAVDVQDEMRSPSHDEDIQAFIDNSDLMMSNQDVIQV